MKVSTIISAAALVAPAFAHPPALSDAQLEAREWVREQPWTISIWSEGKYKGKMTPIIVYNSTVKNDDWHRKHWTDCIPFNIPVGSAKVNTDWENNSEMSCFFYGDDKCLGYRSESAFNAGKQAHYDGPRTADWLWSPPDPKLTPKAATCGMVEVWTPGQW